MVTGFEGVALQIHKENGVDKLTTLIANDKYYWTRSIDAIINSWFDLVIGWNVDDGIAIKLNNEKMDGRVSVSDRPNNIAKVLLIG